LDEDSTTNLLHVALAVAALITIFAGAFLREKAVFHYASAVLAGFLLFCLLIKWQPWHSRLLLPMFVLGAPATGVVVRNCWTSSLATSVAIICLVASVPWVYGNSSRPLVVRLSKLEMGMFPLWKYTRNQIYFLNRENLYVQYMRIADGLRKRSATNIGLILSGDGWEYPLWVLIKDGNPNPVRIEHINVENISREAGVSDFNPDYLVKVQ
jgi:hypothetical protein